MRAVVLVGGFGTRLRPLTSSVPKPMLPLGHVPIIERLISNLGRIGVTEVTLESAELEQIIAALVSPKTEHPLWQSEVVRKNGWLLTQMASGAKKAGIFDYLPEPDLRQQIVQNIYPMHPMATHCLTKMSR